MKMANNTDRNTRDFYGILVIYIVLNSLCTLLYLITTKKLLTYQGTEAQRDDSPKLLDPLQSITVLYISSASQRAVDGIFLHQYIFIISYKLDNLNYFQTHFDWQL